MRRLLPAILATLALLACKGERETRPATASDYEIKPNDNGFKLKTADGKLVWKVKITPDKIKISDNEENEHPFELKAREGDRTKVFGPDGQELGNVRFDGKTIEVENAAGQTQATIPALKASAAYGVLLCEPIPKQEKDLLIAEILARGR